MVQKYTAHVTNTDLVEITTEKGTRLIMRMDGGARIGLALVFKAFPVPHAYHVIIVETAREPSEDLMAVMLDYLTNAGYDYHTRPNNSDMDLVDIMAIHGHKAYTVNDDSVYGELALIVKPEIKR